MEELKVLEKFLRLEFPGDYSEFTPKNKEFLEKYSILKENGKIADILKQIGEETTSETAYYQKNPHVKIAKDRLQYLYERFKALYRGKRPEACELPPFENSFVSFLEWWYSKVDESGKRHCYYCGVDEQTSLCAFDNILSSEKFTGRLQIEKKDPDNGYKSDNCEFACVLCNNAKSDMISSEDFKEYIGPAIKQYWEHIKRNMEIMKFK